MATTRFGLSGYQVRPVGSFAGKPPFIPPVVPIIITRLGLDAYGVRLTGDFSGKAELPPVGKPFLDGTRLTLDGYSTISIPGGPTGVFVGKQPFGRRGNTLLKRDWIN